MPTFTVELDDIATWRGGRTRRPTWIRIGLNAPRLFGPDRPGGAELSSTGVVVYRRLSTIGGLNIWFPDIADTRRAGKVTLCYRELICRRDAGFGPALDSLMQRIVARLAQCGLGDCRVEYTVAAKAQKAQRPFAPNYIDQSLWPKSTLRLA